MVSDVRHMLKSQEGGDSQQWSASITRAPFVTGCTLTVV